jgi:translation initiation factor 1
MTTNNKDRGIVYSTEKGKMCPACGEPATACACCRKKVPLQGTGIVRVGRLTKGCKGKGLTIVTGVPLDHDGLVNLARQLKQKCGAGGTVKDGVIEIQGEHRDLLLETLKQQGYAVKRAGG